MPVTLDCITGRIYNRMIIVWECMFGEDLVGVMIWSHGHAIIFAVDLSVDYSLINSSAQLEKEKQFKSVTFGVSATQMNLFNVKIATFTFKAATWQL